MGVLEFAASLVLAIAGGAAGAAFISGMNERWKFKADRKAKKEDRAEERSDVMKEHSKAISDMDERMKALEKEMGAQSEALKLILLDRILYLGKSYINKGEISYDDRRRFHAMHECYHNGLHGNGDADLIVEAVDDLQLKK